MGGGAGGGGPLDTYVCLTCPGSSDSNPGTQASPFRTIARGLAVAQQLGRPTVFVGGLQGATTTYSEAVIVPNGVVVQGRWLVSGTGSWSRTGNPRTALLNLTPSGVTFVAGAGRSAGLEGLRVISSGAISGATAVAAITIVDASPTILDVQVDGPTGGLPLPLPTTAVGIAITTSNGSTTRSNPRVAGLAGNLRAQVTAGGATTNSFAISVDSSNAELEFLDLRAGNVNGTTSASAGLFLVSAAGSSLRTSSAYSGIASNGTCAGIAAGGASQNIVVENVEARGCTGIPGPLAPPTASVGVSFTTCPALPPMTAAPRVTNSTVQGGVAQGTNSYVLGVLSNDGCALNLENNTITASNAVTIVPVSAAGVICTSELQSGMQGANAPCRVVANTINGGRAQSVSMGLGCVGNCATGNAMCPGSCTEVLRNQARGENAAALFHGYLSHSSPRVARNTFGADNAQCTTGSGSPLSGIYGLRVEGSASRIENNLVIGGQCASTIGLEQVNLRRTGDGSTPGPDVHSNTIVPTTPGGISMSTTIIGVSVRSTPGAVTPVGPLGTYRNNIITALGFATLRAALVEQDNDADPAVLENNNFWTGPSPIGMPPLYFNERMTMLNSAAQINALNGGGVTSNNNMSLDPGFAANFRLGAMSLMRGVGTSTGAPTDDIDGDRRPNPPTTVPDVGCDEVQ